MWLLLDAVKDSWWNFKRYWYFLIKTNQQSIHLLSISFISFALCVKCESSMFLLVGSNIQKQKGLWLSIKWLQIIYSFHNCWTTLFRWFSINCDNFFNKKVHFDILSIDLVKFISNSSGKFRMALSLFIGVQFPRKWLCSHQFNQSEVRFLKLHECSFCPQIKFFAHINRYFRPTSALLPLIVQGW